MLFWIILCVVSFVFPFLSSTFLFQSLSLIVVSRILCWLINSREGGWAHNQCKYCPIDPFIFLPSLFWIGCPSKQPELVPKLVLFRFYTETTSFGVSVKPKLTVKSKNSVICLSTLCPTTFCPVQHSVYPRRVVHDASGHVYTAEVCATANFTYGSTGPGSGMLLFYR